MKSTVGDIGKLGKVGEVGDAAGPSSTACERLILDLAADQHGVVARRQLIDAGMARTRIDYRVRAGRLRPVFRGVYAVDAVAGPLQRPMAAILAAGDDAWVGSETAAALWGLARRPTERPGGSPAPVHITTLRDLRLADTGIVVHRTACIGGDEVTVKDGVPVTAPARTIVDYAASAPRRELEYAIARARREGLVEPNDLVALLDRHPRRQGNALLRSILDDEFEPAFVRSVAEQRFRDLMRITKFPPPQANVRVKGFEVDFLFEDEGLIVEVDGRAYHSRDPAFDRDRDRDNLLRAAGYEVMRVTWRQIRRESHAVVGLVGRALGRRSVTAPGHRG